jgi:hypothetical protein
MRPLSRNQRGVEEGRRRLRIVQDLRAREAAGKLIEQKFQI